MGNRSSVDIGANRLGHGFRQLRVCHETLKVLHSSCAAEAIADAFVTDDGELRELLLLGEAVIPQDRLQRKNPGLPS